MQRDLNIKIKDKGNIFVIEETSQRSEDFRLRLESLEQQIRADKRFLTEQAGEREGEREEFNRKIEHLEDIIKRKEKEEDAKLSLLAKKVKERHCVPAFLS